MSLEPDRLGALAVAKLTALLRERAEGDASPVALADGAAAMVDGAAWVYQARRPEAALGISLVWAAHKGADSVRLILDEVPDAVCWSTGALTGVEVHRSDGHELVEVEPLTAPAPVRPRDDHPLLPLLTGAGLDAVADHGLWLGEINGLEVARLTDDEHELRLGVGAYDRGAFEALYPDVSPVDALPRVIAQVRGHRRPGAPPHLLNRLVRERWLRSVVCESPSLAGLDTAVALAGVGPRPGLHTTVPDAAIGTAGDERVLVVTGAGVDPGLVPVAAALSRREDADRVVVVLSDRDRYPALEAAARYLSLPVSVVGLWPPWEAA